MNYWSYIYAFDTEIHIYRLHFAWNGEVNSYNMTTMSITEDVIFSKFKTQ